MSVSALDSRLFQNLFGTQEIRAVFDDEAYTQQMVDVELALARAQSKIGVIPAEAGEVLTQKLTEEGFRLDFDRLSRETEIVGYPVLPLVRQLVQHASGEMDKYIHWGATTQDIMDTASVLQMRKGLEIVKRHLQELENILRTLSKKYRDTPMAGRTHLQHALPCTFGYKCAVYLSSILRHSERLREIEGRCLLVQFGGAAGTLASLGSDDTGIRVREELAKELGLGNPSITWHVARDNVAEIINFLALVGGSLGKIAYDLILMSSNELSEASEPFVPHRGASSTMPQKRNPISSERASGPWHLEWVAVPEAFVLAVGALHQTNFALGGLVVNTDAMMKNLLSTRGLIVGEAVMMGLAPFLGRQQAHDLVYEACKESIEKDQALFDVLKDRASIAVYVSEEQLRQLCDPANYLGASQLMVDHILGLGTTS
ncbi:hypothetical protein CLAIMM_08734 [Cladophialophora immunda]|nr:hypothetical protein CLAIMM_08734 [Cladophialophora immunda]